MTQVSYTWTLEAYQSQGHLWLKWQTTAPFRAEEAQIAVYNGSSFPSDPHQDVKVWSWQDSGHLGPWDTGLPWGSNWCCAWIAAISYPVHDGPYTYVVQVTTTGASDS